MLLVTYHLTLVALGFQSVDVHWAYEIDDKAATLRFVRADDVGLNSYNMSTPNYTPPLDLRKRQILGG